MSDQRLAYVCRVLRLRHRLTQLRLAGRAGVSRRAVSLLETGRAGELKWGTVRSVFAALGARVEMRVAWGGPELDRLLDANHAAIQAALKSRLERWGWLVRAEVSFSRYGERGRIDLFAWHPVHRILLVVEIKTDLVDSQELLGGVDVKARLAPHVARELGWADGRVAVVPAIVFLDDRTVRRRVRQLTVLFDRFALRGREAVSWLRRPDSSPVPSGLLWFTELTNAPVARISGQRVSGRGRTRAWKQGPAGSGTPD